MFAGLTIKVNVILARTPTIHVFRRRVNLRRSRRSHHQLFAVVTDGYSQTRGRNEFSRKLNSEMCKNLECLIDRYNSPPRSGKNTNLHGNTMRYLLHIYYILGEKIWKTLPHISWYISLNICFITYIVSFFFNIQRTTNGSFFKLFTTMHGQELFEKGSCTLYDCRWLTTQVKKTSRPWITVWFSKGAKNSGKISGVIWPETSQQCDTFNYFTSLFSHMN